eukprot:g406.t1
MEGFLVVLHSLVGNIRPRWERRWCTIVDSESDDTVFLECYKFKEDSSPVRRIKLSQGEISVSLVQADGEDEKMVNHERRLSSESILSTISTASSVRWAASRVAVRSDQKKAAAVVWEPNRKNCFICNLQFIFYYRRVHHCRMCGRSVCNACSLARIVGVGRCCDVCANDLQSVDCSPKTDTLSVNKPVTMNLADMDENSMAAFERSVMAQTNQEKQRDDAFYPEAKSQASPSWDNLSVGSGMSTVSFISAGGRRTRRRVPRGMRRQKRLGRRRRREEKLGTIAERNEKLENKKMEKKMIENSRNEDSLKKMKNSRNESLHSQLRSLKIAVRNYKKGISTNKVILDLIDAMSKSIVTADLLRSTGAGKYVARLGKKWKERDDEIAVHCKTLIKKWKKEVSKKKSKNTSSIETIDKKPKFHKSNLITQTIEENRKTIPKSNSVNDSSFWDEEIQIKRKISDHGLHLLQEAHTS